MKNYFGENEVVLFHGSDCKPENIIHYGFDNVPGAWLCSEFNQVYFYELKRWCKCEGYKIDDESVYDIILRRANEQGQIQNAVKEEPTCVTYVYEFHFPEEFEEFVETDESCDNMEYYGAVQVNLATVNKYMQQGKCKLIIHTFPFSIKSSLLYITGLADNPNFDLNVLDDFEQEVLASLAKGEFNETFYEKCVSWPDKLHSFENTKPMCDKLDYIFK